jgi:hypothetical protein
MLEKIEETARNGHNPEKLATLGCRQDEYNCKMLLIKNGCDVNNDLTSLFMIFIKVFSSLKFAFTSICNSYDIKP